MDLLLDPPRGLGMREKGPDKHRDPTCFARRPNTMGDSGDHHLQVCFALYMVLLAVLQVSWDSKKVKKHSLSFAQGIEMGPTKG